MDLAHDLFEVTFYASKTSTKQLLTVVSDEGYEGAITTDERPDAGAATEQSSAVTSELLTRALEQARAEGKMVLLDFKASWCAPCLRLEKETFVDSKVAPLLAGFVLVKVDTDEEPELARQFGVAGIPDLRFLTADGKEVGKLLGFQSPDELAKELKSLPPTPAH